jgi:hypothetical protein
MSLSYRTGALVELYSMQLLLINPKDCNPYKKKIVHTSCVLCVHYDDELMMIYY